MRPRLQYSVNFAEKCQHSTAENFRLIQVGQVSRIGNNCKLWRWAQLVLSREVDGRVATVSWIPITPGMNKWALGYLHFIGAQVLDSFGDSGLFFNFKGQLFPWMVWVMWSTRAVVATMRGHLLCFNYATPEI